MENALPHPGPLPLGEGASPAASEQKERAPPPGDGLRFSLSQRERAGVRENASPLYRLSLGKAMRDSIMKFAVTGTRVPQLESLEAGRRTFF